MRRDAVPVGLVDVDLKPNGTVRKIRDVVGHSAESPGFVETLPRQEYRFLDELECLPQPVVPVVEPDRGSHPPQIWRKICAGVLATAVVASGAVVAYRWHRQQSPQEQADLTALPFTALPGRATSPAFSPDGSRIAFA